MEARGERIFRKSHTLAVRSSEPETTLSSRVKVTHVTTLLTRDTTEKFEMLKNSFQFDYHTLNALGIQRQSGSGHGNPKDGKLCPSTR